MRKITLSLALFTILIAVFFVPSYASASEEKQFTVRNSEEGYILHGANSSASYNTLEELIDAAGDGAHLFFDKVAISRKLTVVRNVSISGTLSTSEDITVESGAELTLTSASVTLDGMASILVSDGKLTVDGGTVGCEGGCVVRVDGKSSYLYMTGGRIITSGVTPALIIKDGTAELSGGVVENLQGCAVENGGVLRLGRNILFNSGAFDILTHVPITLKAGDEQYSGSAKVKYSRVFSEGEVNIVFYNATSAAVNDIELYDINNKREELTFFEKIEENTDLVAVYKPYTVKFISAGVEIERLEMLSGESLKLPLIPERLGYSPRSWCTSAAGEGEVSGTVKISSDLTLYASYSLLSPEFSLTSREGIYDGKVHSLSFDKLTHPLEDSGFYTYKWVNEEGRTLSETSELLYTNVSDSGRYKCILTFHHGQDSVTVETPYAEIRVHKRTVQPPTVLPEYYTGKPIYPDIPLSPLYIFEETGYTDAGIYTIAVKLTDSANNCFLGVEGDEYLLEFEILRATNFWIDEISVTDIYYGAEINFRAIPKFGEVSYLFSSSIDGEYLEAPPTAIGIYFVKASVAGSDNYTSIISEPRSFEIIDDTPISLTVSSLPKVTEYSAFDYLLRDGLEFTVLFSSGRRVTLTGYDVTVRYQKDDCFRYGDTAFFAEYLGVRTSVPVTVKRAEYVLDLDLPDAVFTYDGTYKSYPFSSSLPMGKDGLPLGTRISGGGCDTGEYVVCLTFVSGSVDYELPDPLYAKLIIEKRKVAPVWQNTSFIYDGTVKCPVAYYTDCYGAHVPLLVEGGAVTAGRDYIATAYLSDSNYELITDTVTFSIEKAYYDLTTVRWTESTFVYDGEEKHVSVLGLPPGVSAIGYTDSYATEAGEYRASVALSYDTVNYNAPTVPSFTWRIEKADYDLSGITFSGGEHTYDGTLHYPVVIGDLPIGKDGIGLSYSFSGGVRNVGDNPFVIVTFSTESKNYNIPDQLVAEVVVQPLGIYATWDGLSYVYNGSKRTPLASAAECELSVSGSGTDAGVYTAHCTSLDMNYTVINSEVSFEILKAANSWISDPTVGDVFFGRTPEPEAEAYFGKAEYKYYSDKECQTEVVPSNVGIYYAVATVPESANYLELVSSPVEFSVIEIIPIGIEVAVRDRVYYAFEKLNDGDFTAEFVNNDGSRSPVASSTVSVSYESGDTLLANRGRLIFEYGVFSYECEIEVARAIFDTSGVRWENTDTVYDGERKDPTLTGLPSGITLLGIEGCENAGAGEYELKARLEYDAENYEPPVIPKGVLIIRKKAIKPEIISSTVYNGTEQYPQPLLEVYRPSLDSGYRDVGEYEIEFVLTDTENYVFDGSPTATFTIRPCDVVIKLNKIDVYLFEDALGAGYTVTSGTVFSGDDLELEYVYDGERVYASAGNGNYNVTVTEGVIEYIPRPTPKVARALFICVLLAVILILILFMGVKNKERIVGVLIEAKNKREALTERKNNGYLSVPIPKIDSQEGTGSIDAVRADELISNGIAKTLIRRSTAKIATSGRRRAIINVDTLSENFSGDEVVDINTLKDKGLIPKDTGYLKVLARGRIDKALKVFANSYSISAVKMIALMGGEVNRVSTVKIKEDRKK